MKKGKKKLFILSKSEKKEKEKREEKKRKRGPKEGGYSPRRLKNDFFLRNGTRNLEAIEAKKNRISSNPEKKKKRKEET